MVGVLEIRTVTVLHRSSSIVSGGGTRRIDCNACSQVSPLPAVGAATNRGFNRLKVHRVKDLVKESYRKKKLDLDDEEKKTETSQYHIAAESDDESKITKFQKQTQTTTSSFHGKTTRRDVPLGFSTSSSKQWGVVKQSDRYNNYDRFSGKEDKTKTTGDFFSRKTFKELGCSDYIVESLSKIQYLRPSHIQAMAFASVVNGKSCIVADQSGSGKTLAYLVPIVQRLRQEEIEGLSKPETQNPRVVILVPTAELASQVLNVCRSFSKAGVPFRSMVATGGFRQKTQLENLRQDIDVLIATPGRFMFLVKEGFLRLTNLRSAILDEVDILYNDEDFEQALQSLVSSAPITTQYLFVTATLPVEIYKKLVQVFPDSEVIMGPGMHRTSSGLEEILVDCSGGEETEKSPDAAFLNKKNALLELARESPVMKTIVFCNKIETCRKVENALKRFDRKEASTKVLPFHAALEQDSRIRNIHEFHSSPSENTSMFLICTDRASRGIDFSGVNHVVLFDFPRDPSEYVRRVGRTARGAGGQGTAYVFAVGKQVTLARRIIERNRKGHPLHDIPSAYE
ncbi:hypothetical protein M569_04728, partial [Genlisea aurea]